MKQVALASFLKKKNQQQHKDASRTITAGKMELFVALVSNFQLLTNFMKNPNIGAMAVLNVPPEYYNIL